MKPADNVSTTRISPQLEHISTSENLYNSNFVLCRREKVSRAVVWSKILLHFF